MTNAKGSRLYQHRGIGLLRAAAMPLHGIGKWPDLTDATHCRTWLRQVWSRPDLSDAIRHASPSLAARIDGIVSGDAVSGSQVRRAATATARYLARATGRATPFGLFAGVAPTVVRSEAKATCGVDHRARARVDTQWLADVVEWLETTPDLLERLDVVFNDLAEVRGGRLSVARGPEIVTVRYTSAVHAARVATTAPTRFSVVVHKLIELFPGAARATVHDMLADLVWHGILVTSLRAPNTVTDPLGHLVNRLLEAGADSLNSVALQVRDLVAIHAQVDDHNRSAPVAQQGETRKATSHQMRELSSAGRTLLAVDLRLDFQVEIPGQVAHEMEWAASALVRLSREPAGVWAWRDWYTAFVERYGTGTLVPLADVVNPDTGLGLPAGYPGSLRPEPPRSAVERDKRLLALAWQAMADDSREIVLSDDSLQSLTVGDPAIDKAVPPHVELAARIFATDAGSLERGEFTLVVSPARSAGTLTSRFAQLITESGLEELYRSVPTATEAALPVQLSFPPAYPHSENVGRVPAYLQDVLAIGEHRDEPGIRLDDLAITATRDRLHLVSLSRQKVIEPQVFHALALEKQAPALARFLAHLPRACIAAWHKFDWGSHTQELPFLPSVRYRRSILSPATWRLTSGDLPTRGASDDQWRSAFDEWRHRWRCPDVVELREDDRTLRLALDNPTHAAMLRAHLLKHERAELVETANSAKDFGWINGHAHELVLPLTTTRPAVPHPQIHRLPQVSNARHGQHPGSSDARWLYAKLHCHPDRQDEILTEHLPQLLAALDEPQFWFIRYHSPTETDHLRLRLCLPGREHHGSYIAEVGDWARRLRQEGVAGRLVFDTYYPETGRYVAMDEAEGVFVTDSRVVAAQMRHPTATSVNSTVMTALSMVDILAGLFGTLSSAMGWLTSHPEPGAEPLDRILLNHVVGRAREGALRGDRAWDGVVVELRAARERALATYRAALPVDVDIDSIAESLLHMHHNRALGIDPGLEQTCRRLARQAALTWTAQ